MHTALQTGNMCQVTLDWPITVIRMAAVASGLFYALGGLAVMP